jgi:hypothetical protein
LPNVVELVSSPLNGGEVDYIITVDMAGEYYYCRYGGLSSRM